MASMLFQRYVSAPDSCSLIVQPIPISAKRFQPSAWLTVKPMPMAKVNPNPMMAFVFCADRMDRTAHHNAAEESTSSALDTQKAGVGDTCTQNCPMLETI